MTTEETFGQQGKPNRKPTHEERLEKFERAFGFEHEPEPNPTDDFAEADFAGLGGRSWSDLVEAHYKKYPQARPPAPPKKFVLKGTGLLVAPGTTSGDILEKLIPQITALIENHAKFVERLNRFESELEKQDPCYAEHGPGWRLIDSECVKLHVSDEDQNAPAQKSFTKSIKTGVKTRDCGRGARCNANGTLHEHSPSGGIFGYELN